MAAAIVLLEPDQVKGESCEVRVRGAGRCVDHQW